MEKGVIEVMDKQKNKAIIDTVSSIMQSSNQKTTLRCIQKDEEIQPDPWRMFIQKTSDLREYLWTTDEISNKEDCYCCWHIESFSPNWVAAKKRGAIKSLRLKDINLSVILTNIITHHFKRVHLVKYPVHSFRGLQ